MHRVFLLDNEDSFTFNVAQLVAGTGADVFVQRAHAGLAAEIASYGPTHLILSPGPLCPEHHPMNATLLRRYWAALPILGICLGMQAINHYAGGSFCRDVHPMHGKQSAMTHRGSGIFSHVPASLQVARYHSLRVDHVAPDFDIVATTGDPEVIMAIAHQSLPIYGVQFHPESFMTDHGAQMTRNFLGAQMEIHGNIRTAI